MSGRICLHMIHIAGSRMISQGTDGLSRGNVNSGVMTGLPILQFVPLHLSALQRSPPVLSWVGAWSSDSSLQPLSPEGWFTSGHGIQGGIYTDEHIWVPNQTPNHTFLWCPAPAAASATVDELAMSRLKRTHILHIFLCPRLFTSSWRKKLYKVSDLVVELPLGHHEVWPHTMHETLLLSLTLPFIPVFPWQLKNTPRVLALGRALRCMWQESQEDGRDILRQLCNLSSSLASMSPSMVQDMLYAPSDG